MSDELMNRMNRMKRTESPLVGIGLTKKNKDAPKEDNKPAWAKSQLRKGGGGAKTPWADDKKKDGIKPDWSGRGALKKTERKTDSELDGLKRTDWRDQLKKSGPKSPGYEKAGGESNQEPEWKSVSLRATPKKSEEDD